MRKGEIIKTTPFEIVLIIRVFIEQKDMQEIDFGYIELTLKELLEQKGLVFSGINEASNLVEIVEIPTHPHFIASQFHPEFKSRPTRPHPLFDSFIKASIDKK